MTVATQSREQKKIIVDYLEKTGARPPKALTLTLTLNPNPNPNP